MFTEKQFKLNRRQFLALTGAGIAAAALPSKGFGKSHDALPNFIVIFTDDQGYNDLGCFGSPNIKTPNVDQMAAEGMKFTDFYTSISICTPARASILTGCYAKRAGFTSAQITWPKDTDKDNQLGLHPDEITLAELLKAKDYKTACVGKWHLGDYEPFLPTNQGFDRFYGIPYSNDMNAESRNEPPLPLMRDLEIIEQPTDNTLLTQKMTAEALTFIEENKDNPFFLYLPQPMPHDPPGASPEFAGKSDAGNYGDAVEELDWSTGQILQKLKDLGIDQNTCVIFTSDNGPWLQADKEGGSAAPLRGGKFEAYEGGLRMPCVMWWPGTIPAGSVCSEISTIMDFFPTFAGITGIALPDDRTLDGKDIQPLMKGEEVSEPLYDYFIYHGANHKTGANAVAIRHENWKYFTGSEKSQRLYDLSQDIGEDNDISDDHLELCENLKAKLDEMNQELRDNARPLGDYEELTAVKEMSLMAPTAFEMVNYPNPFNSNTTLTIIPERTEKGRLKIIDIRGREMFSQAVDLRKGVKMSFDLSFSGRSTGVYYAMIEINHQPIDVHRMTYLK